MHLLPLLAKPMKSDEIVEVLEAHEMEVVYDFDRTHENIPDRYWASSRTGGFQFGFDEAQVLEVIFLHIEPEDGFAPFSIRESDVAAFPDREAVLRIGKEMGVRTASGSGELNGILRKWARLDYENYSLHYEFRDGALALVTIQIRNEN